MKATSQSSVEDSIRALQRAAQTLLFVATLLRGNEKQHRVLARNPFKVRGGLARARSAARDARGRFLRALGSESDK